MNQKKLISRSGWLVISIFFLSVLVRLLTAEYIDIGGDNAMRWTYALGLVQDADIHISHHSARWAILVPLWGVLEVLGTNPSIYYVLPIIYSSIGCVLIYLIGERLSGKRLGILSALLVMLFPQMTQSGSQLWPSVFQFVYIAAAVLCLLQWKRNQVGYAFLLLAAFFFFLAWGARLTAVYFFPGLLMFIWLPQKTIRPALIFSVAVGVLCLIEWGVFWAIFNDPMGRLGVIHDSALNRHVTYTFSEYLLNFVNLKKLKGLLPVLILTIGASIWMLRSTDWRWRNLSLLYLTFLFLMVYMISGVSPLRRAGDPSARFWCAAAPFGLLLLCQALLEMKKRYPRCAVSLLGVLFVAFIGFSLKKIPATNSVVQVAKDHAILAPTLSSKRPVEIHWQPWNPNLVEGVLFDAFGVTKRSKGSSKGHIETAMGRARHRMVAFNLGDISEFYEYYRGELVQQEELVYLYLPPGASKDSPPGAVLHVDRRHAYASLPQ